MLAYRLPAERQHDDQDCQQPQGPKPESGRPPSIGRHPVTAFHLSKQNSTRMARERVCDAAVVIDDRGESGIGGADERPFEFERPHTRNIEVLVYRDGIAEPSDVAHIDEDVWRGGTFAEARTQLFAKQVFVADVRGEPLAAPLERRLADGSSLEVTQRDVHHG